MTQGETHWVTCHLTRNFQDIQLALVRDLMILGASELQRDAMFDSRVTDTDANSHRSQGAVSILQHVECGNKKS